MLKFNREISNFSFSVESMGPNENNSSLQVSLLVAKIEVIIGLSCNHDRTG